LSSEGLGLQQTEQANTVFAHLCRFSPTLPVITCSCKARRAPVQQKQEDARLQDTGLKSNGLDCSLRCTQISLFDSQESLV